MRSFGHWTPRYLYNRVGLLIYQHTNSDAPWINPSMTGILDEWLGPEDVGLEWGSGRSTCWLAKRVKYLTSVEENQTWGGWVKKELSKAGLETKVDYRIIPNDPMFDIVHQYVAVAESISNASLDFCFVDGRARDACALISLAKIKAGGILILDDSERYYPRKNKSHSPNARSLENGCPSVLWEQFATVVSAWRCVWTSSGITDAAFWIKPTDLSSENLPLHRLLRLRGTEERFGSEPNGP